MSEDFLTKFPDEPLSDKQMNAVVLLCVENDKNYKKMSDKIVHACLDKAKTPLKIQKLVVDRIKEVIKAEPKKFRAQSKFFALKLLNKVILKKNGPLNVYVEQKIMDRLSVFAEFNNDPHENSAQALLTRGKNIFGPEEKDTQSSANFLIILLDCIEKWALTFLEDAEDINDAVSTSTKNRASAGDKFYKAYQKLIDKGVKFPSTFKSAGKKEPQSPAQPVSEPVSPSPAKSDKALDASMARNLARSQTQQQVVPPSARSSLISDTASMSSVLTTEKKE